MVPTLFEVIAILSAFTIIAGLLLLTLPRRFASIPLVLCITWATRAEIIDIGSASFTALRILVLVGILRVILKGEYSERGVCLTDKLIFFWSAFFLLSSAFHVSGQWIFRSGVILDVVGSYFLFRIFMTDWTDVEAVLRVLCAAMLPVALLMWVERFTGINYFYLLGGVDEMALIRGGQYRANGPFSHAILAGSVGATTLTIAIYLIKESRLYAIVGLFSGASIVYVCNASGPILVTLAMILGLLTWKIRQHLRAIRIMAVFSIVLLDLIMRDPWYFIMARVDITGGSQGYFRARLIQSSIEHLNEWWLIGTDYTRHWMPTGIVADPNHTDMTNHFLSQGVKGGLGLMFLFTLILISSYKSIGRVMATSTFYLDADSRIARRQFLDWSLGAVLLGYIVNFFSVSLFDQSAVFYYLILASIATVESSGAITNPDGESVV